MSAQHVVAWLLFAGAAVTLEALAVGGAFLVGGWRMYRALDGGEVEALRENRRAILASMARDNERTLLQLAELRSQTVWGVHVEGKPSFSQGSDPLSELHELVTAKECQQYVDKIEELTKNVAGLNAQVAILSRALEAAQAQAPRGRKQKRAGPLTGSSTPSSES